MIALFSCFKMFQDEINSVVADCGKQMICAQVEIISG